MNEFRVIPKEELIVALARELRVRKVISAGRTAPEGTPFEKLHKVATEIFPEKEFGEILIRLLAQGSIILSGHLSKCEGKSDRSKYLGDGKITALHPDAKIRSRQFFTENWTPMTARYSSEGVLLYPNNSVSYHALTLDMVYVVSDGLPQSMQTSPVIYPLA